jgi:hypothetical protein
MNSVGSKLICGVFFGNTARILIEKRGLLRQYSLAIDLNDFYFCEPGELESKWN